MTVTNASLVQCPQCREPIASEGFLTHAALCLGVHIGGPEGGYADPFAEALAIMLEDNQQDALDLRLGDVMEEDHADRILNRLAGWREEIERVEQQAQNRISRLEKKIDFYLYFYGPALEAFAQAMRHVSNDAKTIYMPCGINLQFRRQPAKLVVTDQDAYAAAVREQIPEAIEIVPEQEKIRKTVVNEAWKRATKDGHTFSLPGTAIVPAHEKFSVASFKLREDKPTDE